MLYLGTSSDLPVRSTPDLSVEEVEPQRRGVRQWFTSPHVKFIGAHTRCSCGFPSVMADVPIEYYDGMLDQADDRQADLRSVRALLAVLEELTRSDFVELYPIADGEEEQPPKGQIEIPASSLDPERFFFNERFMHVVPRADPRSS